MKHIGRIGLMPRLVAAVGALALGTVGVVAAGTPASAAVPPNVDTTKDGTSSIVVHKHAQQATAGAAGNGSELADTSGLGAALNGVNFALYKLSGVDLTTTAGWNTAQTISTAINGGATAVPNADPATSVTISGTAYPVTAVSTKATAGTGVATFGSLGFGIYLVVEGTDTGSNQITSKAQPFVVSLPFATGTNTWLYDVHAYPKNSVTAVTKSVSSAAALVGGTVKWSVSTTIPDGADLTSFSIKDTFDTRLDNLAVDSVTLDGTALTTTPAQYAVATSGQTLTVTPTLSLVNAKKGKKVTVVFSSKTKSLGSDGVIPNTAVATINGTDFNSNQTSVKYGAAKVLKYAANSANSADRSQTLAGAKFALYLTNAEAVAAQGGTAGTPVWTGTTPSDGTLKIGTDATRVGIKEGTYYLVETAPPAGYKASSTVYTVNVVAGAEASAVQVDVPNTQIPAWALPLTGGSGTALFTAVGVLLLVLAAIAGAVVARRNRQNA